MKLAVAGLMLVCGAAQADGLSDLKGALGRLNGVAPVKAALDVKVNQRSGEGKDLDEQLGQASIVLEDSSNGLRLTYGKDMMARLDGEAQALVANPNAKTPTTKAAREFEPVELRPMIAPAATLARTIERASFKGEKAATYEGKAARQLNFDVPVESLSDRQRKHIKEFNGNFDVWIGADGVPLASRLAIKASGRAFLVVGFDFNLEEQNIYTVSGERLLTARREVSDRQSGAGEQSARKVIKTLRLE